MKKLFLQLHSVLVLKVSLILVAFVSFLFTTIESPALFPIQRAYAQSTSGAAIDMQVGTRNYDQTSSYTDIENSLTVNSGDVFEIAVVAQGVSNLDAFVGTVYFDTTKLDFVSGSLEDSTLGITNFLKRNGGILVDVPVALHGNGQIIFGGALKGQDPAVSPEGSGIIALIKFRALTGGDASLSLHDIVFTDSSLIEYRTSLLSNGVVHVSGTPVTYTPTGTLTPLLPAFLLPSTLPTTGLPLKEVFFPFLLIALAIGILYYRYRQQHDNEDLLVQGYSNVVSAEAVSWQSWIAHGLRVSWKDSAKIAAIVTVVGLIMLNVQTLHQSAPLLADTLLTETPTETATETLTPTVTSTLTVTGTVTETPTITVTTTVVATSLSTITSTAIPSSTFISGQGSPSPIFTATFTPTSAANTGRIRGFVKTAGTPIIGAKVTALKSPDWLSVATAVAGSDGSYTLFNLVPTNYRVRYELAGQTISTVYFRNKLSLEQAAIISVFSGDDTLNIDLEYTDLFGSPTATFTPVITVSATSTATTATVTPVVSATTTPTSYKIGDFDHDQKVYYPDLVAFANHYLTTSADSNWNSLYDLTNDSRIDAADLAIFKQHWLDGV